jgi:hypothetical protein
MADVSSFGHPQRTTAQEALAAAETAVLTRHDDGTVTVEYAGPVIRVAAELLDQAEPWAWDGHTLTLDTAGRYRYCPIGPDPDDARVLLFSRDRTSD